MAFPDEQIQLGVEMAFGADLTADPSTWTWTELGTDTETNLPRLTAEPITITKGVAIGGGSAQVTSASVQALNSDGWLTPGLPVSPWYPYVDVGTPIRVWARTDTSPYLQDTFTRVTSNGWGTPTVGNVWAAGTPSACSTTGSVAQLSMSATNLVRRVLNSARRDLDVTYDCSIPVVATGAAVVVGVIGRYVDTSNHLFVCTEFQLGGTVEVKVRTLVAGNFLTFMAANTSTGVTYTAGAMIRSRVQIAGDRVRIKVWPAAGTEPAAWHLDVHQRVYTQAGPIGLQVWHLNGNTNPLPMVVSFDNVTVQQPPYYRAEGYVGNISPTFNPLTDAFTWSEVTLDVAGIGSLAEKNLSPAMSPLRRSVQLSDPPPVAYWPLEDAASSTVGASAFPGETPMQVIGPAVFAFSNDTTPSDTWLTRFGTKPLVSLAAGAKLVGYAPNVANTGEWAISLLAQFFVPGIPLTSMRALQWETPGAAISRWAVIGNTTGYIVRAYDDSAGTSTDVVTFAAGVYGSNPFNVTVEAEQNGTNIDVRLYINDAILGSGSITGAVKPIGRVTINPDRANTTASTSPFGIKWIAGHLRVINDTSIHDMPYYFDPDTSVFVNAQSAWFKEAAHRRIERLCAEERVPFELLGNPIEHRTIVGAQQDGAFTGLIEAAVEAESGGLLVEDHHGYAYLPRDSRYNQPVALTVDLGVYKRAGETEQTDVLVPQLDSRLANYWTITRTGGTSASYAAPAAYRKRRGTIAEERTLDVLTDADPLQHAAWRTHVNVDGKGPLYPSMPLDLHANPELIEAFLGVRIGSRVRRTGQPWVAGLRIIDQVVLGIRETLSPMAWTVELTTAAGDVWDVGVYDDAFSRYDSASTTLAEPIDLAETGWDITTVNAGDVWSTTGVPYNWDVDGEIVTVTAITVAAGTGPFTQTATVVRGINGITKTHLAGAKVQLAEEVHYAL